VEGKMQASLRQQGVHHEEIIQQIANDVHMLQMAQEEY
jgi:hypothetical protein